MLVSTVVYKFGTVAEVMGSLGGGLKMRTVSRYASKKLFSLWRSRSVSSGSWLRRISPEDSSLVSQTPIENKDHESGYR